MKFKKILSGAIAAVTLATSVGMFQVSATTYDNCDVNRDGVVNVTDLILLEKYLSGIFSVSNYNQLDVNKSLTVDAVDSECIAAKLTGSYHQSTYFSRKTGLPVSYPNVSGFTSDSSAASTASRTYTKYNYRTAQTETYTLTPTVETLNSGVNSLAIIDGSDSRYLAFSEEITGIVCLYGQGTGFIVGDHQIATAASCVYDRKKSTWNNTMIFAYDSNGVMSKQLNPVEIHVPNRYISSGAVAYDYALITVEDDLSQYIHFSLANSYNVTQSNFKNVPVYVTGCPDDSPSSTGTNTYNRLYSAEGNICSSINVSILNHNIDTTNGQNGSPIYTISRLQNGSTGDYFYIYTALGIHQEEKPDTYNQGSLITKYHLQFYNNNPNINYTLE